MDDLISRKAAIDAIVQYLGRIHRDFDNWKGTARIILDHVPPAQPEIEERMSETEQNVLNDDFISRKGAIDAIEAVFPVDPMKSEYAQGIACGAALSKTYIEQLPSAQPEWKWIPVSKRPPDEGTYVLISKKPSPLSGKKWCVTIAGRFVDGRSKKVEWRDIGFGRIYDDDVLAWMPRPEPYGGEQE